MPFDPLPTPSSLVDAAVAIDSALAQTEIALRQQPFVKSMSYVSVQANGTVELDLVSVNDDALTDTGWPIETIRTLCQEALASARAASEAAMLSLVTQAPSLSLPGVPGVDDAMPNWAGFAGTVDGLFALADYAETKMSSMTFVGSAGPIMAVVNASLDLQQLTVAPDSQPATGIELGQYVRDAVNQALQNAKNLLDDYIGETGDHSERYTLPSVVLFASSVLKVGDDVQLKCPDGSFASSANAGVAETSFGAGAQVGDIWSRATVALGAGAQVNGSVRTSEVVAEQDNVVITGDTREHIIIDAPVLALNVELPSWNSGDIIVNSDCDAGQDPGSYGDVVVNSGATLRLSEGVYYFETFDLDQDAVVILGGKVTLFVRESMALRGSIQTVSGARPEISISYLGTETVSIESRFDGVVAAPFAKVTLASVEAPGYTGAFLANEIEVAQGVVVTVSPGPPNEPPYGPPPPMPEPPAVPMPTGLSLTPGDRQVAVAWNAVAGATLYNIYYGTAPGLTGTSPRLQSSENSLLHAGLINGRRYYYRVAAVTPDGESQLSTERSAVPQIPVPAMPEGVSATAGDTIVNLAWSAVPTATSYNVYYATTPGVTNASNRVTVPNPFYLHDNLTNGVRYYYRVSALNIGGESPLSVEVSATPQVPAPNVPAGVTATAGNGQVTIAWTAVPGATSYNIYYATTPGVTKGSMWLPAGSATSYVHYGRTNGTRYYYCVSAVNAGGESPLSVEVSAMPQVPAPPAPIWVSATPGNGEVTIAWSAVSGANSYNIYYATAPGVTDESERLPAGGATSYLHSGLTNGTRYYYRVAAVNAGGEGPLSVEVDAVPQVPAPGAPICVHATPGNHQVTVAWSAVSGASSYNIYYATAAGVTTESERLPAGNTTSYVHPNLTNGTRYYYRVSAVGAGGESPLSVEVNAMPQVPAPCAPTGISATPGDGRVTIAWSTVSGATSYNVYYATSPGVTTASAKVAGIVLTSYLQTGRTNGIRYYYRVSAVNAGGESPLSIEVSAVPQVSAPSTPTGVVATPGNGQVTIAWNAVSGATSYNVYYATSPGVTMASAKVAGIVPTSYLQTGRNNGTTYYYRVSALNAGGESPLSSEVSATPHSAGSGILGFESASDWHTTSGTLTRVTSPRTQGAAAVQISGNGYAELTNITPLTSNDVTITARFLIDLFIPTVQPNPYWMGQLQLFFTCPSHSIFHQFVGQQDLTGLSVGAFHTIEIAVPTNLRSALQGSFSDLTLGIALNVDQGCGPHVFDNIRFLT